MKRITEYTNIETITESDVLPIVDVSDTEQASTGSTRKGSIEKIADYLKDRAETQTNKTLTSPTINAPIIDNGSIGGGTNVVEVLKKVYPVGCLYISTVSTSPATLFGFGIWTLVGEGKALFGVDSTDTDFNTAEETGGSKTVTLTAAQSGVPAHTHPTVGGSGTGGTSYRVHDYASTTNSATGGDSFVPTSANSAANASEAHSNLPPYYTAYFYKRTA